MLKLLQISRLPSTSLAQACALRQLSTSACLLPSQRMIRYTAQRRPIALPKGTQFYEVVEYADVDENTEKLPKWMAQPDEIVSVLTNERAKNIEVVKCDDPNSPYQYLVIASPYNARHGSALVETVRRYFCRKYSFEKRNPRKRENARGWYVLDLHNGMIHIMRDELRAKYNLAAVWTEESSDESYTPEPIWLPPVELLEEEPKEDEDCIYVEVDDHK